MGGFIENKLNTRLSDFNGNISSLAKAYLNSFELPIMNSVTLQSFMRWHMLVSFQWISYNKIPASENSTGICYNTFHYSSTDYTEVLLIENILKSFRFDYYWSFKDGKKFGNDFRISITRLGRGSDD
jgi:hypothetical protein